MKPYASDGYKNIFTDEKIFTVEQKFNKQNDLFYTKSRRDS